MRHVFGLVVVSGLVLGSASQAQAQVSLSFGNPYGGNGVVIGQPVYGAYGNGYNAYGSGYNSYNGGYAYPSGYGNSAYGGLPGGTTYYSSGYYAPGLTRSYAPVITQPIYTPGYYYSGRGTGGYGYRNYAPYGYARPFPFRRAFR